MNWSLFSTKTSALLVALALFVSGCATSVERVEVDKTIDLSGAWNDTDSQLVSAEMMQDVMSRAWLDDFTRAKKRKPAVIVGEVRNLSHEHINVNTFVSDLERAMVNSNRVQFVASSTEREEIRGERKDQDLNATEATRKAMGAEKGADFMLKGTINTIIDASGKTQLRFYQVDLTLISLVDNEKVWIGQKKIKKLVERSKLNY
jgi:uncharacterized protein (TIGR02722 family)